MTDMPGNHIAKTRQCLDYAHKSLAIDLIFDGGRNAYIAAYHAALAYVIYKTNKSPKSHSGVRSEFGRLAKDEPRIDRAYATFLTQSYNLKTVADYGVETADIVSRAEIDEAIVMSEKFVDCIDAFIKTDRAS